ncbi:MAG: dephospho-CoA kinase [Lutibacter sp.]
MIVVGLTGGIGSGKSTVLNYFKYLGATIFIADEIAKQIMNQNVTVKEKIIDLLGNQAYNLNQLNRAYIASVVFNSKTKLKQLNAIVHPEVKNAFQKTIKKQKKGILIYESALLFESNSANLCDYNILVMASYEDKISRLLKRDNTTKIEIEARMSNQKDDDFKIPKSHFIIRNDHLDNTKLQVSTIYKILQNLDLN